MTLEAKELEEIKNEIAHQTDYLDFHFKMQNNLLGLIIFSLSAKIENQDLKVSIQTTLAQLQEKYNQGI